MYHIWLVLELLQAVKTNNLSLYAQCLFNMSDLFFSFDGHNYSRYLTFFAVFLANIDETHPGACELLKAGAISVARSLVPGNRCAVDKTIEETFMKHAKSHGGSGGCGAGLTGLLSNFSAYQRWVKTTHERAQYVDVTRAKVGMESESHGRQQHKDLRQSEVKKSEKRVQKTKSVIQNFLNPFDVSDHDKLYCISSGAHAPEPVEKDMMTAEQLGKQAKETFIVDRLETKKNFFSPVKKMKLRTFHSGNKTVKLKTAQNKIITYKQHSSVALQLLVKSQSHGHIDVDELLKYPLSPVPYSLGTADGFMAKTDKSKGLQFLVTDVDDAQLPFDANTLLIQDGNALFHTLTDVPNNFMLIAHRVFDSIPKGVDVVFSTDMYHEDSVKDMERQQRGSSEKLIIGGPLTKKPPDWRTFLMNGENKSQLVDVINDVWCSDEFAPKLVQRKVVSVVQGHCYVLESADGEVVTKQEIPELYSDQEETDTRVILYCAYAQRQGYGVVRIRSPDSDIFFIALHHAQRFEITILFDTGTGNNRRLINISALAREYGQVKCTALMSLHAYTHCDTTSAFKGIGKIKPTKLLQKSEAFQATFSEVGASWQVSDSLHRELEVFTCVMYGRAGFSSVDAARAAILREKCGGTDGNIILTRNVDLSQLPPCQEALHQHLRRVNYQVGIWRAAHLPTPDIPLPTNGNGWVRVNTKIQPLWFNGPLVPADLAVEDDSLPSEDEMSSDDSDSGDIESDGDISDSDSDED